MDEKGREPLISVSVPGPEGGLLGTVQTFSTAHATSFPVYNSRDAALHELGRTLVEYEGIKQSYKRRIARLMEQVKQP